MVTEKRDDDVDPSAAARLRRIAEIIGWGAFAVALIVLVVGWGFRVQVVASILPDTVAMKPNTALGIGVSGLAIAAFVRGWPRALTMACGAIVAGVAAVTLIAFATGAEFRWFDELLFQEVPDAVATAVPGRMAINTAVALLLLGVGLVLLGAGRLPSLRQTLAAAVATVSFIALMGYLLGVPGSGELFVREVTRMALTTAACLLLLSFATVAARPDVGWARLTVSRFAGGAVVRRLGPIMLGTLLLIVLGAHVLLLNAGASVAVAAQVALSAMIVAVMVFWGLSARLASRIDSQRERQAALAQQSDAAALRANHRLGLMFDSATIGMVTTELDARIVTINPAFASMLGRNVDELVGTYLADITHPDDLPALHQAQSALESGEIDSKTYEKRYVRPDGSIVWVRLHAGRILDEGVLVGYQSQYEDTTAVHDAAANLEFAASHDALTGLPNRATSVATLERLLSGDDSGRVGVLVLNIDRFRLIDEAISRTAGDQVLVQIARRLDAETQDGHLVSRLGADEFLIVVPDAPLPDRLEAIAQRLRDAIAKLPFDASGTPVWLTASIGVALDDGPGAEQVVLAADAARLAAKTAGGDTWRVFTPDMRREAAKRLEVGLRLRAALEANEVHAWYQPVVNMADRRVAGYEALARWIRPSDPPVVASDFIRAAHENGLIMAVGHQVTTDAVTHLATLPRGITVALNASPLELANPAFVNHLESMLSLTGADPRQLVLEVTEDALLSLNAEVKTRLTGLVGSGIGLDVDDFGTGFSSLVTLRDYPVTGVKLDQSFTYFLGEDPHHPAVKIAKGIAQLAESLGLTRTAEGIETEAQEEAALELGWVRGQGWLYGKAGPSTALL